MPYAVSLRTSAAKHLHQLERGDREAYEQMTAGLQALKTEPRPAGARKLTGRDSYLVRVRDWRIVYGVDDAAATVDVLEIGQRGDVDRR